MVRSFASVARTVLVSISGVLSPTEPALEDDFGSKRWWKRWWKKSSSSKNNDASWQWIDGAEEEKEEEEEAVDLVVGMWAMLMLEDASKNSNSVCGGQNKLSSV